MITGMFRPEVVTIDSKPVAVGVVRRALVALTALHQIAEALRLSDNQRRNPLTVARLAVERCAAPAPAGVPVEERTAGRDDDPIRHFQAGSTDLSFYGETIELSIPEAADGRTVAELTPAALRELRALLNDARIAALLD